jgi:hypothetical protein
MEQTEANIITNYIVCSRCHMKFVIDDEHIKTDFGYNRLNIRCKNCVTCRTFNREEPKHWEDVEQQIETYGRYDPNRNKKHCGKKEKLLMTCVCDLCGKTITSSTKDKHIDSPLCKGTRNLQTYGSNAYC